MIRRTHPEQGPGPAGRLRAVVGDARPPGLPRRARADSPATRHQPTGYPGWQGPDWGDQYRSAVFYENAGQRDVAQQLLTRLRTLGYNVVTQLAPAGPFYEAEGYHQDFTRRTGRGACHMSVPRFSQRADGTPVDPASGLKKP